jgi:hypothetical protein
MSDDKLQYRLLTGSDDVAYSELVSDALADGYVLFGSPAIALEDGRAVAAQAVVLAEDKS